MADEAENLINAFDRRDIPLRWKEYKGSIKWYRLKNLALTRAGNRCQYVDKNGSRCKARKRLEMHHLQYQPDPNDDSLEDVVILCQGHHKEEGGYA